jgi:hypothetical protein
MEQFSLSLAAVDVLSQTLDLNARVFPFEIPSFGTFETDRVRIAKAVFTDLSKRGLIRQGTIDPDLTRALRALADYRIAVAAMGQLEENRQLYARAAANGETAVLAVQEDQKLRLAITMVGLLPKLNAGPGQSVTLTQPSPAAARRDDAEPNYFSQVRAPRSGVDQAFRIAESYLTRPRTGSGFFVVFGRGRHGKEIRGGEVSWYDTDVGRYLSLSKPPTDDGQVHGTFSPADPARLTQQLTQLIDFVARN